MLEDEGCTWVPNDNDKLALSSEHFLGIKEWFSVKQKTNNNNKKPLSALGQDSSSSLGLS